MSLLPFGSPPGLTKAQADALYEPLGGGGGGSSLSPSYHLTDVASATTIYSGINSSTSTTSDTGWKVTKLVTDTDPVRTRTVYTATGSWDNRASLTYTTSLSYSI